MKKEKLTGILIDTKTNQVSLHALEHGEDANQNLHRMYEILNCEHVEIVERKFGKHYLDIVCDDEGLFKEERIVSVFTQDQGQTVEQIVGNVFICSHDEEGNLISLTNEQINSVLKNGVYYFDENNNFHRGVMARL